MVAALVYLTAFVFWLWHKDGWLYIGGLKRFTTAKGLYREGGAWKSTKELICQNHLHANHDSLLLNFTGRAKEWLWLSSVFGLIFSGQSQAALWLDTLGNQIFGTIRILVVDLQTKIGLVNVMGTFPSGCNASTVTMKWLYYGAISGSYV